MTRTTRGPGSSSIVFGPEADGLEEALVGLACLGLAVEIELASGTQFDGVMVEVVAGHLALRGFNEEAATETDDLLLVPVSEIARVAVP
jgi:hypothetical protein